VHLAHCGIDLSPYLDGDSHLLGRLLGVSVRLVVGLAINGSQELAITKPCDSDRRGRGMRWHPHEFQGIGCIVNASEYQMPYPGQRPLRRRRPFAPALECLHHRQAVWSDLGTL